MSFEKNIASLNEFYFFREFTFSHTTFRPIPTQEVELADNVIWLGNNLLLYQLKEREEVQNTTPESERDWFENKVLKKATRQIRDTLAHLQAHAEIKLKNHREDEFCLRLKTINHIHKLVVYLPHKRLPAICQNKKFHRSKTAGVIHIFTARDYKGLVQTLLTPAEFADYLEFREALIDNWEPNLAGLPEQSIVGQYLSGKLDDQPSFEFVKYLEAIEHKADEWDMSGIISNFPERTTSTNHPTDYYHIVREISLLKRSGLREFKLRYKFSIENAKANKFVKPYRMTSLQTNCGFVFIPISKEFISNRQSALINLTHALKYDQKLPKCIGVSITHEKEGWFFVEWCFIEFPWKKDQLMADKLKQNYPFREGKIAELNRYDFKQSKK
jgi:hypothetical protein